MCAPFSIPRSAVIKCIPKPAPPPAAGIKCIYYQDTAAAGREKEKVHTLGGHQEQNNSRQKVHTLGNPVLFTKSMHTRQPQIVKKCIH